MRSIVSNNIQVRKMNEQRILREIYIRKCTTQQDVAQALSLSQPTVTQIVKELIQTGVVIEKGTSESSGGRKPLLYAVNSDFRYSLGINIKNNRVYCVLTDFCLNILTVKTVIAEFDDTEEYWSLLAGSIQSAIDESGINREKLLGVCIALPRMVVSKSGRAALFDLSAMEQTIPYKRLSALLPYPIDMDADATLAGFAETWMEPSYTEDVLFLLMCDGIGGAIRIGGTFHSGDNNRSGEFGHMIIETGGVQCSCGKKGCFSAECAPHRLLGGAYTDLDQFFYALSNGEPDCTETWSRYLSRYSIGIDNLRSIFDVGVVICGEASKYYNMRRDELFAMLNEMNSFADKSEYVRFGRYGDEVCAVGAAAMQIDNFISNEI